MSGVARVRWLLPLASLVALIGCSTPNPPTATPAAPETALRFVPEGAVAVTVNGEPMSEALLIRLARARGLDPADPSQRQQALDLAVETLLLAQDAVAQGLPTRAEVQTELDMVRIQALAARNLADARAALNLGDEELRAYYERVTAQSGSHELHLRNVLYADEAAARAAAAQASASADFGVWMAGIAAGEGVQARDLGWANAAQLPPELAQAALALPDGGISAEPVRSRFGWHVFQRVDSRPFSPPPFEEVREGIRKQAGDEYLEQRIASLRANARIEETPTR